MMGECGIRYGGECGIRYDGGVVLGMMGVVLCIIGECDIRYDR